MTHTQTGLRLVRMACSSLSLAVLHRSRPPPPGCIAALRLTEVLTGYKNGWKEHNHTWPQNPSGILSAYQPPGPHAKGRTATAQILASNQSKQCCLEWGICTVVWQHTIQPPKNLHPLEPPCVPDKISGLASGHCLESFGADRLCRFVGLVTFQALLVASSLP